jgi:hypothetical protein
MVSFFPDIPNKAIRILMSNNIFWTHSIDGVGTRTGFSSTRYMALDPEGNILVSKPSTHVIRKISDTANVTTLAGGSGVGFADGFGNLAKFNLPGHFSFYSKGQINVSDLVNSAIRAMSPQGNVSTLTGGTAGIASPRGLATSSKNLLVVADYLNNVIRKIDLNTSQVSTIVENHTLQKEPLIRLGSFDQMTFS